MMTRLCAAVACVIACLGFSSSPRIRTMVASVRHVWQRSVFKNMSGARWHQCAMHGDVLSSMTCPDQGSLSVPRVAAFRSSRGARRSGRRWGGAWRQWARLWRRPSRGPRMWKASLWAQRSTSCRPGRSRDVRRLRLNHAWHSVMGLVLSIATGLSGTPGHAKCPAGLRGAHHSGTAAALMCAADSRVGQGLGTGDTTRAQLPLHALSGAECALVCSEVHIMQPWLKREDLEYCCIVAWP